MADAPRVVLPVAGVLFGERGARMRQLAQGHAMAEFLLTMADLADAQHAVVSRRAGVGPSVDALVHSRDFGMPPLAALSHVRDTAWLADLREMAAALGEQARTEALCRAVSGLDDTSLEALADRVLCSQTLDTDAAAVPLVGAALQLYFTRLAAALDVGVVQHSDVAGLCPVCATRPMASILRTGAGRDHLRYLSCALCATEWNLPRIQCCACQSEKAVGYLGRAAEGVATLSAHRAEVCDACQCYLKIFDQEQDPFIDPLADDLASLALDIAVGEQGYARAGPNLLWHFGSD